MAFQTLSMWGAGKKRCDPFSDEISIEKIKTNYEFQFNKYKITLSRV